MVKYRVQPEDLYNFDETGFIMGQITSSMVVTRSDRRRKAKSVQPGNREWAIVIEYINTLGWCIPPFVIIKGIYHLSNWTIESVVVIFLHSGRRANDKDYRIRFS